MNILFIGDIFASAGRSIVAEQLPGLVRQHQVDLVIANAENSAGGFGITPLISEELLALGIDVLTGGNHSFDKREIYEYLDRQPRLLRPANYPDGLPGSGVYTGVTKQVFLMPFSICRGGRRWPTSIALFAGLDQLLAALEAAASRFASSIFMRS